MAAYDLYKMTSDVKYPLEWLKLRQEIEVWISETNAGINDRVLKNSIYVPIKMALGITTIDLIETWQVPKARRIFYAIRDICEGVDPNYVSEY